MAAAAAADVPSYGATPSSSDVAVVEEPPKLRVVLLASVLVMIVLGEGYDSGVLNGAVVRIQDDLKCSVLELSMLVAVTPLCFMPGAMLGGYVADSLGRRMALVMDCVILIIGPICMALAPTYWLILASRGLVGAGIGMGLVVVSMYLAEVAPTHMRGHLTALEDVALNAGKLSGYFMNWWLLGIENDWRWMVGLGCIPPLVVFAVLFLPQVPESPRWLFSQGREAEAERVLTMIGGKATAKTSIEAMRAQGNTASGHFSEFAAAVWHNNSVRRMFLAAVSVGIAQTACGYMPMAYYSSTIMKKTMSEKDAFAWTMAMGATKFVVTLFTVAMVENVGRRLLLLTSTVCVTMTHIYLATSAGLQMAPVIQALGFSIFMAGFSVGLGPLTLVYVSEVFSTEWRAKGMSSVLFISRCLGFASTFVFPISIEYLGVSITFWLQAGICSLILASIYILVFETSGLSLEGIEKLCK